MELGQSVGRACWAVGSDHDIIDRDVGACLFTWRRFKAVLARLPVAKMYINDATRSPDVELAMRRLLRRSDFYASSRGRGTPAPAALDGLIASSSSSDPDGSKNQPNQYAHRTKRPLCRPQDKLCLT